MVNNHNPSLFNYLKPCPTLWDAISDLPPLKAGEGAEEFSYTKEPLNEDRQLLRNGNQTLFNHKAMNHSKRMVERFAAPDSFRFMGKPTVVSHKLLAREGRLDEKYLCQYNQIGNAVPPLLAQAIASNLLKEYQF